MAGRRTHFLLGGLADQAESFVKERVARIADAAKDQTDAIADRISERFSGHLVEQIQQRLAWAGVSVGALIIGVWLLAVGLAGALGELLGKAWLGQVAAGVITLAAALGAARLAKARRSKQHVKAREKDREREEERAEESSGASHATSRSWREQEAADADRDEGGRAGPHLPAILRRHPLAGAAAIGAAAFVARKIMARANGRDRRHA